MNPFVRFVNWILDPTIFLLLRLFADFVAAASLLLVRNLVTGLWFAFVALATLFSAVKAKRQRRPQAA